MGGLCLPSPLGAPPPGFYPFLLFPGFFFVCGEIGEGKKNFTPGNQFWPRLPQGGHLTLPKRDKKREFPRVAARFRNKGSPGLGPWAVTHCGPFFFFFFFFFMFCLFIY
eukprot:FR734498.1.p2 GENE.FR734498.1~~FR734498.1.p2  ORF type:complete len:127 (-),score=66.13 FR734498.1:883-1209(-)